MPAELPTGVSIRTNGPAHIGRTPYSVPYLCVSGALYRARVDPILRRRIAALLLVAGVVIAVLAITDVGPFDDPPTEEERVQEVVEEFFASAVGGEGRRFCELMTRDARRALEVNTAQQLRLDEPPACVDVLTLLRAVFKDAAVEINHVNVSGPAARVEVQLRLKGAGAEPRTVLLTVQDGEWLVSNPDA